MEKGRSIRSSHIGILSSQGIESIPVYSVPVAGIMATGDELLPVGTPLEPGKIYDSNGPLLAARIRELGCLLYTSWPKAGRWLPAISSASS